MQKLEFYIKEPSVIRKALFFSYGYTVPLAPVVLSAALFDGYYQLIGYAAFGSGMIWRPSRKFLIKMHEAFQERLSRFKLSYKLSKVLRETLENGKLVFVDRKETYTRKGQRRVTETTMFPAMDFGMDDYNYYLTFHMLPGQTVNQWENKADAFSSALKSDLVKFEIKRGVVEIVVQHTKIDATRVSYKRDDEHYITIGYAASGPLKWEFDEHPHCMIIGETGQGKSTFLRNLLVQFQNDWIVKLVDGKLIEFSPLRKLGFDVASEDQYIQYIEEATEELHSRLQVMEKEEVNHYMKLGMQPYFLVVDELAIIMDGLSKQRSKTTGESEREKVERMLKDISLKGRAAGIFLMMVLQRPDSSFIPTIIRDNAEMKVVLGDGSETAYEMAYGQKGREIEGLEKGMGYAELGRELKSFSFPDYKQEKFMEDVKWARRSERRRPKVQGSRSESSETAG